MTETERKGIEKSKMGLIVTIALVVILAISNVWSYTSLQNQINTLSNEKSNLQSQVNTLQTNNTNLENELDSLNTTYQDYASNYTRSNSEYDSLNTTYHNYMATHSHSDSEYDILANEKNQLQTWLYGNISLLQTTTAERNQLQTWLDGNITNYESQISSLNIQITNLQNQIYSLNSEISSLNAQITSLQSQIDSLKAPKLKRVNLKSSDNRPWLQTPYLRVYGEIVNVGTNTAYNCKLHVVAYQDGVVAFDTYILLGTIYGESWTSIDENLYYSGEALTASSISSEWTS